MAIVEIPIPIDSPSFKIRTILDGTQYVLKLDWNDRFERWSLSIFDESEVPLLMGIPLHINSDVVGRFEIEGLPLGQFMLFDNSLKGDEATRDSLGNRTSLLYEEAI